jgi:hypothetical protein
MTNPKNPWLLAAITTAAVGAPEAATILHLIPGTTIIDTGALLLTGFFAGLFTGLHLMR